MNPWTVALLIGSFVPVPHISAITSVTCKGCPAEVKSAALLGQKDRNTGSLDFYPARVLTRLQQAEAREPEVYFQQHIRQAWIVVSLLQKGVSDAFVRSSYTVYGKHPDLIWSSIVADRKQRLGAEYYDWYDSADVLRPDVPKIPSSSAATLGQAAAGAGSHPHANPAPVPNSEKEIV